MVMEWSHTTTGKVNIAATTFRSLSLGVSKVNDCTKVMCVPRPRWKPAQLMQRKQPRFAEYQRGTEVVCTYMINMNARIYTH